MAGGAAFGLEELLAALGVLVELVGVGRGLEGFDVEGEGVELLVAVAGACFGAEAGQAGLKVAVVAEGVHAFVENGVAHDVPDAAVAHQAGGIQVFDVRDPTSDGTRTGWVSWFPGVGTRLAACRSKSRMYSSLVRIFSNCSLLITQGAP